MPDDATEGDPYQRPDGVTDATVAALGKFSEAYELLIRARGRLYDFHQMMGRVDFMLGDAADLLEQAGHPEWSQRLRVDLVGHNVMGGRWTFQLVDEFDRGYWELVTGTIRDAEEALASGRRHLFEADLKEHRRSPGRPGHELRPPS